MEDARDSDIQTKEGVRFSYISQLEDVQAAVHDISTQAAIAVDCEGKVYVSLLRKSYGEEGVSLSRTGRLTLLQVATPDYRVYLFDVLSMGVDLFEKGGLKRILEDTAIIKIFFDCRTDSDCLFHQFGVTLSNLFDVSVSDVWIRFKTLPTRPSRLHGFKRCVESYLLDAAAFTENHQPQPLIPQPASSYFQLLKERVSDLMNDSSSFWEERPLTQDVLEYAAFDVSYLMELFGYLSPQIEQDEHASAFVSQGSLLFAGLYRDKQEETPRSHLNARIPLELRVLWQRLRAERFARTKNQPRPQQLPTEAAQPPPTQPNHLHSQTNRASTPPVQRKSVQIGGQKPRG